MIFDEPQDRRVLFLDMNCFFARVEQQVQPSYRGRPVAVAPYTGDSGCIITSSYEARNYGVRTGLRVGDAKRICPQLIVLPSRPSLYHTYHKEIVKVAESFSPFVKVMSIDEMAIKLTGRDRHPENARQMAINIKTAIRERVGDWLTCSVGIGPNQFLAKTAGEMKKPDGLSEIQLHNLKGIYQTLKLTDLCGINRGISRQCHAYGIYSPWDLYCVSLDRMIGLFGTPGKVWYLRLRGYEIDSGTPVTKSLSHSYVLPPELRTGKGAKKVVNKLVGKVGYRLRCHRFWATELYLSIKYMSGEQWQGRIMTNPLQDDLSLIPCAYRLFNQAPITSYPLKISFHVGGLVVSNPTPLPIFSNTQKATALSCVIDTINDAYGASTIYFASLLGAEHSAPDRISFGKPGFAIRND